MNKLFDAFQHNVRRTSLAAQILVLLMMTCVNIICVMTSGWMSSKYNSQGVILFSLFITMEAMISCLVLQALPVGDDRKPYYRLAEGIVILLIVKIFTEIRFGLDFLIHNLISWPRSFAESFLTLNFLFNAIITLILWLFTTLFLHDLTKIGDETKNIGGYPVKEANQSKPASTSLRERFFAIGALIVFLAGIMRQDKFRISDRTTTSETVVPLVIAYFLLGMILLSLTYFSSLRVSWGYEQFAIHKNMTSRWILYFLIFLVCLGLVVFFLPTKYSMDLFTSIRFIINWLFIILKWVMIVFLFPFFWIFNQISRLLGKTAVGQVVANPPPQLQQPEQGIPTGLPGWEVVKSLLFWLVFLAIIYFAIRQYIQSNRRLVEMLHQLRISRWISEAWNWIAKQFQVTGRGIGAMIEAGVNRLRLLRQSSKKLERWHYINPNRMIPRQKIFFFYLSVLRRAGEAGTPRRSWETPIEFSKKLGHAIPEGRDMVAALTKAFMEARYGPQETTFEDAVKTRTIWVRLSGILRKRRQVEKHT